MGRNSNHQSCLETEGLGGPLDGDDGIELSPISHSWENDGVGGTLGEDGVELSSITHSWERLMA